MNFSAVVACPCCGENTDVEVEATVSGKYRRQTRLDPAEEPEAEIESVTTSKGRAILDELPDSVLERLKDEAIEEAEDDAQAAKEAAAESRADAMRDERRWGRY